MVVYWGTFYTFGIFFKPLSGDFEWTRAMTAAAFTINGILFGVIDIAVGKLNDRFGPRVVVTASALFLGLGYILMSQIDAIWQFYLFYGVIVAIGMGGSYIPLVSTVARWFVKRRGLMTGIVVSGIGIGTMLIPPIAAQLIKNSDWSTSYLIVGSIALVFITLAAQFLRRDPAQKGQMPYGADKLKMDSLETGAGGYSLSQAIRTREFWILCALFFIFLFCINTIMVHIAVHATDLKYSETEAASIVAAIGGVSILGRLAFGILADRLGTKLVTIISLIVLTASLFWLQFASELWMLYLFAVIFGFGYGGLVTLASPLAADLFGLSSHGIILGIAFFFGSVGQAAGPLLAGRMYDTIGYQPAFLACSILGIISIILALLMRTTTGKGGANDSRRSA